MAKTRGTGTGDERGGKRGGGSIRGGSSTRGKDNGISGRGGKKGRPARSPSKESTDDDDDPPTKGGRKTAVPKKKAVSKTTAARPETTDGDDAGPVTRSKTRSISPPKEDPPAKKSPSPQKKAPARDVTKPRITVNDMKDLGRIPKARKRATPPSSLPPRRPKGHRVENGAVAKPRKRKRDSLTIEETASIKNHQKALTNLIGRMGRDNDGNAWSDVIATLRVASERLEQIRDGIDFVRVPPEKDGEDDTDEDEEPTIKKAKTQGGKKK